VAYQVDDGRLVAGEHPVDEKVAGGQDVALQADPIGDGDGFQRLLVAADHPKAPGNARPAATRHRPPTAGRLGS
jgi:hypothetical protein